MDAKAPVKWQMTAVVVRADGTREDLGVIGDTRWRRLSIGRLLSNRRIRRANRRLKEGNDGDIRS